MRQVVGDSPLGGSPFPPIADYALLSDCESCALVALCEKMLGYASPLNLYAEEIDARSGRHLGNHPQTFTHLALSTPSCT